MPPEAATIEPPAPPAPTSQIEVSPASLDQGPPPAPPKPGSARDRMFSELRKKSRLTNEPEPRPEPKPSAGPKEPEEHLEDGATGDEPAEPREAETKSPGVAGTKKEKVNPWNLVKEYKTKLSELEKQVVESKTSSLAENDRKAYEERLAKATEHARELEEEIRYVNYSKSQEFKDKYEAPYRGAWERAAAELSEIMVTDAEGAAPRQANVDDLLNLVKLPLGKARELANVMFGDFADDAMAHRKEIRGLFDAQQAALKEARENGAKRDQERSEAMKRDWAQRQEHVKTNWAKANETILSDPKYGTYFKPVEGDEEGNQRLAKGYQLADRAFSENPLAPGLNADQRRAIVERHAAVRNRCAAFGRLVFQNSKLESELADLKKKLGQYESSEPGNGTHRGAPTQVAGSARERMFGELRNRAKSY